MCACVAKGVYVWGAGVCEWENVCVSMCIICACMFVCVCACMSVCVCVCVGSCGVDEIYSTGEREGEEEDEEEEEEGYGTKTAPVSLPRSLREKITVSPPRGCAEAQGQGQLCRSAHRLAPPEKGVYSAETVVQIYLCFGGEEVERRW